MNARLFAGSLLVLGIAIVWAVGTVELSSWDGGYGLTIGYRATGTTRVIG